MAYRFNPWSGLGAALREANKEWNTRLKPNTIASLASRIAKDLPFANRDFYLAFANAEEDEGLRLTEEERHAAHQAVGSILQANKADKRAYAAEQKRGLRELRERTGS